MLDQHTWAFYLQMKLATGLHNIYYVTMI